MLVERENKKQTNKRFSNTYYKSCLLEYQETNK